MENIYTIDTMPMNSFHKKVVASAIGGYFTSGYILGIISFALIWIVPEMQVSPIWEGLIGGSPLIGVFIGSLFFGSLADKYGRRKIYLYIFLIVAILSLSQILVNNVEVLFIVRVLLGVAIGGDYAVNPSVLSELIPEKLRAKSLSYLLVLWSLGYVLAAVVGFFMTEYNIGNWKLMLASSTIFGIIVFLMRLDIPESPVWLQKQKRNEEAKAIITKYFGGNVVMTVNEETQTGGGYSRLFTRDMWKKTIYASVAWLAGVIPLYGIMTFLPTVLMTVNVQNEGIGTILVNVFMLLGSIAAAVIIDWFSRKKLFITTLVVACVPLFILGINSNLNGVIIVILFCIFMFFLTIMGTLTSAVIPAESFSAEIRSQGVGFCTAVSRIGSAFGTFVVPALLGYVGLGPILIGMGLFLVLSIVMTAAWGPKN